MAAKKTSKKVRSKNKKKTLKKIVSKKKSKKVVKKAKKSTKKVASKKVVSSSKKPKKATSAQSKSPSAQSTVNAQHPLLGGSAPSVVLSNQRGESLDVAEISQAAPKVVLYFYPKDDTPGCTAEACAFRDSFQRLQGAGIKVYGVSPDDPSSHQKFISKYNLNFDLLSDTDHKLCEAMKVWKEKNFMGRTYMGVERSTFLFSDGTIKQAWQPVKVEGHVDEVLSTAEKF